MKFQWNEIPNEIPVVFHNGSNCDYHFIIEELAKESASLSNIYTLPERQYSQSDKI